VGIDIDESPSQSPAPAAAPAVPLKSRNELAADREKKVDEAVMKAAQNHYDNVMKENQEKNEMEQARAKHDVGLTNWSTDNKQKRNIRTLLTTMHTVLWTPNKWKTIGLGDVLEARQVKLQYRKAMLIVHPDRCSGESAEIRFIAKRVFEGVNEAWEEFLKKESV
jgi:hypothetical protein